jgi:hypothetical protein
MELYLAKLLGLYFIIVGIVILIRRKSVMPTVKELASSKALLMVMAIFEIIAGLAIVLSFPMVTWNLGGVLSIVGYMMVVEGIIYLALPSRAVQKFVGWFNRPGWYIGGGILAVIVGICLAGHGFGYF